MHIQDINEKIRSLPPYLKQEVLDYIDFLSRKHKVQRGKKGFSFKWEGGLKELKGQFDAVNLQHKAKDYR